MTDRYPGYDVLGKRWTPSWDTPTRRVIDDRLSVHPGPRYLSPEAFATLKALCERILPQPPNRPAIPLAAYVDHALLHDRRSGYRNAALPPLREAWTRGLAALDAEAREAYARPFAALGPDERDALIRLMQAGALRHPAWEGMGCDLFFTQRVLAEIPRAYYAHPTAWSEIGFGGPASPRGYVRLDFDRRDPWEAAEAQAGQEPEAARKNARVGRR